MLLGGKGGCQQCSCVPCDDCTRTCTEPHTGSAFETVYTYYVLGAEEGNTSDGYLTATGDNDTSDPYDGMDGTGPWYQEVSGSFTLSSSTTRFPCSVAVSFWRSTFTLGAVGVPPPSSTLTLNRIRVSVSSLSETGVYAGNQLIAPGGSYDFSDAIPVVSGSGDRSAADPRSFSGTISVTPECANKTAMFTISARVEWNTQKRQHIVYGIVRECYEVGTPCATVCSGSPSPSSVYLTISNYTGPTPSGAAVNGTYVLDRVKNYCEWYLGPWAWGCLPPGWSSQYYGGSDGVSAYMGVGGPTITASSWQTISGECRVLVLWINTYYNPTSLSSFCGPGIFGSGTNGVVLLGTSFPVTSSDIVSGSFDWKIES